MAIQEQTVQLDVNVVKIEGPKNHTVSLVKKLRQVNKLINNLKELHKLRTDL